MSAQAEIKTRKLDKNAVVALYETHAEAEEAVRELQKSGFDMQKLSIVGKDYQTEEDVVGYYTTGGRMKAWGKSGAFWGGLWGMLFGSASVSRSPPCRKDCRQSRRSSSRWAYCGCHANVCWCGACRRSKRAAVRPLSVLTKLARSPKTA